MENLLKRIKSDKGNAIAILGIMLIMVSLVVGGMMLDLSKAYQFKASYTAAAKKATQAGIRIQSAEGYLTYQSVLETIRVYEFIARPSTMNIDNDSKMSRCSGVDGNRIMSIYLSNSNVSGENLVATIKLEDDSGGYLEPYRTQYLNSSGGSSYSPLNMNDEIDKYVNWISSKNNIKKLQYDTIKLEISESTPNFILPSASKISGEDGFKSCQNIGIVATASQFIGAEDGEFK